MHCGEVSYSFKECATRKNKENIFCKACNLKNDHESGDKKCSKMIINFNRRNQSYSSIAEKNSINPIHKNETYLQDFKAALITHSSSRVTEKTENPTDLDEKTQINFI